MTARAVLLLSIRNDPAVALVAAALEARGARPIRFDTDAFPTDAQVSMRCGTGSDDVVLESEHGRAAFSELSAIWLRRLDIAARLPPDLDPRYRAPARDQAHAALVGVVASFRGRVLDPLRLIEAAADKPRQLQLARALGFDIPRTLLTNDPAAVRDFAHSCPGGLVTKPLSALLVDDGPDEQVMYTSALAPADLDDLDGLRLCPLMFQEHVPKQLEIRATVVGRRVFAAAVDSAASARGQIDWRRDGARLDDHWQPHSLPAAVADRLVALVAELGLTYSAADLILTPDGRHVFLESNPAGEWLWLEQPLQLGIAEAIADELLAGPPRAARRA
jgi:hypothetical protein